MNNSACVCVCVRACVWTSKLIGTNTHIDTKDKARNGQRHLDVEDRERDNIRGMVNGVPVSRRETSPPIIGTVGEQCFGFTLAQNCIISIKV
ncbi:hypothetical protein TNCV_4189311 [Trichonephila clavipes]|nr:hypothetical protein TNCV_4189311 [Trichonephila clavipes]